MTIYSVLFKNYSGIRMVVDCDVHQGFPSFDIIINSSLSQSHSIAERLRVAIRNQDFKFPNSSVALQVHPNVGGQNFDVLDLPLALCVILNKCMTNKKILAFGALDFAGCVRKSACSLDAIISFAKRNSFRNIIIPHLNEQIDCQRHIEGFNIIYVSTLQEAVEYCIEIINSKESDDVQENGESDEAKSIGNDPFSAVIGLDNAKRALIIAAAGGHNALLVGPRGSGKSLLLSKFNNIFCQYNSRFKSEREQNRMLINQQGEIQDEENKNVLEIDNYNIAKYFNISASHPPLALLYHGLYIRIDEIADIEYRYLQLLKDIIDKGYIVRANDKYPLHLSLIAAINPCPCGNKGLDKSICLCPKSSIEKHIKPLRNSLLTRFEMIIPVSVADFSKNSEGDYSHCLEDIAYAHLMQEERYKGTSYSMNSDIVRLGLEEKRLREAFKFFSDCDNIRDVLILYSIARTIADLDRSDEIKDEHIQRSKLLWVRDIENLY